MASTIHQENGQRRTFSDLNNTEKLIDSTRLRTNNFAKNLDSYYRDTFGAPQQNFQGTGLPSWNYLNASTQTFLQNIKGYQDLLDPDPSNIEERMRIPMEEGGRRKVLDALSVFPNEKFPYEKGYGNDETLFQLLRRKPDPQVSAWEAKMIAVGEELEKGSVNARGERVEYEDWRDLWNWAVVEAQDMMRGQGGSPGEDEDEEDEEDEMEGVEMGGMEGKGKEVLRGGGMKPVPLVHLLNYLSNGTALPGEALPEAAKDRSRIPHG